MRIGIIGAGAIGGWLAIRLADAGHDVSVLARGATLAALRSGPWSLHDRGETVAAQVTASDDPAALGVQDLLILAVKGPALGNVLPAIRQMCDANTLVMPAMNGVPWWFLLNSDDEALRVPIESVDPAGALGAAVAFEQVIGSVVYTSASVPVPGRIEVTRGNQLIIGEPDGRITPRLTAIAEVLTGAGIETIVSDRVRYDIWYKLWGNMTVNPISAMTGATSDRILDDPLASDFILRVMDEAQEIGRRIGLDIAERGEDRNAVTRSWGAFKTSMLQDAEAGRAIELDQLVAAPREIASRLSVETPALDALLGLTRVFARQRGLYPDTPSTGDLV